MSLDTLFFQGGGVGNANGTRDFTHALKFSTTELYQNSKKIILHLEYIQKSNIKRKQNKEKRTQKETIVSITHSMFAWYVHQNTQELP